MDSETILNLGLALLMVASMWKLFTKAGQPGWAAIVPVYNLVILLRVVQKPAWWLLGMIVPLLTGIIFPLLALLMNPAEMFGMMVMYMPVLAVLNIIALVFFVMTVYALARVFGESNGVAILTVILAPILIPVLAFGAKRYQPATSVPTPSTPPMPATSDVPTTPSTQG